MQDQELIESVVSSALLRGEFTLRSGRKSNYYLDKYRFETQPGILRQIARRFAAMIEELRGPVHRLAGAELGGIPLVTATSLETNLPAILVRNSKKDYGTQRMIEGVLEPGERVVLLEDIVTSGGQSVEAVNILRQAGAVVEDVLVVIDRQEGARETIEAAGVTMQSLLTRDMLGIES
ncbi:MAG: orotate phosphoribosyltransferase [Phycisphaeraceae bacterium]|nr:orotate phosphoribosyltransferase [Phycisphaeraceae bacterium]